MERPTPSCTGADASTPRRKTIRRKTRVFLSSRPKLLSDVLRSLIGHQHDMEVVGEVIDPMELLRASRTTQMDVVIVTPLETNGDTNVCSHLLSAYPTLKIVTLSGSGGAAYLHQTGIPKLHIEDPSAQVILDTIRGALALGELDGR